MVQSLTNNLKKSYWQYPGLVVLIFITSYLTTAFNYSWLVIPALLVCLVAFIFIYQKPERGILLIAFFLPFERIGAIEIGSLTIRLSQLLLLITLAAWLFKGLTQRNFNLTKNHLLPLLSVFLLISFISIFNSPNLPRSLIVFGYTIFTCSLAFIVPQLIVSRELLQKVLSVILISATLVGLFGLWQFFGDLANLPTSLTGLRPLYTKAVLGFPRIQATAYEPLYFANYLLLPLVLLVCLWLKNIKIFKNNFWLVPLILLLGLNFVLTVARGAYLALTGVFFLLGVYYLKQILKPKKLIFLAGLVVLIILASLLTLNYTGKGIKSNWELFTQHLGSVLQDTSFTERNYTLKQAVVAWTEHPIIGIGTGAFGPWLAKNPLVKPIDGWAIVNNQTLETLAENGLAGLLTLALAICLLILRQVKALCRTRDNFLKTVLFALLAILSGIMIQYQTFSTLYIMHVWFIVGLMIAGQNLALNNTPK